MTNITAEGLINTLLPSVASAAINEHDDDAIRFLKAIAIDVERWLAVESGDAERIKKSWSALDELCERRN
jgi:hypothetical protein